MTKRQAITPAMKIKTLFYRGYFECTICKFPISCEAKIEWDHIHALVHGGEHAYLNLRPVHAKCHKGKTARDVAANAKVKRLRGETCTAPKKPIQSRGFDKTRTRKFGGQVVPRGA